jgi:hypothetical protein
MKVTGLAVGLLDVAREREIEFHDWYEVDHLPENLASADVTGAARYVATEDCLALAGPREPELFGGARPRFLTVYQLAAEDVTAAGTRWWQLGRSLSRQKRGFDLLNSHAEVFGLQAILSRSGVVISREAIPHLAHRGVLLTLTQIPDPDRVGEVDSWWREVHGPDVLQVPGFLAGIRLHGIATGASERGPGVRALNLYLLDCHPPEAIRAMGQRIPEWKARGRLASPGGPASILWNCPYQRWRPSS